MTRHAAHPTHVAVYTGVFDPVHLGHLTSSAAAAGCSTGWSSASASTRRRRRSSRIEERVELLRRVVAPFANVEVRPFNGLAVRFVREVGARIMLRGLRTTSDMEYEFTMSLTNLTLDPEIETVFLMAKETYSHVSSTLLRQIATFGGDLDKFVPPEIEKALQARAKERGF